MKLPASLQISLIRTRTSLRSLSRNEWAIPILAGLLWVALMLVCSLAGAHHG